MLVHCTQLHVLSCAVRRAAADSAYLLCSVGGRRALTPQTCYGGTFTLDVIESARCTDGGAVVGEEGGGGAGG